MSTPLFPVRFTLFGGFDVLTTYRLHLNLGPRLYVDEKM